MGQLKVQAQELAVGQSPPPPSWPLPYRAPATEPHQTVVGAAFPPAGAPSAETLDYVVKAITAGLLLLALPALLMLLATDPVRLMTGSARKHVG